MKVKSKLDKFSTIGLWSVLGLSVILFMFVFTNLNNLFVMPLERFEEAQSADVIIVLGGGVVKDTRTLPWSVQERMQKGIELYNQGYANNMIMAGGIVSGESYTESEVMAEYAQFAGIPSEDLYEENISTSTYENAINSLVIMDEYDWDTALIVTSDYHTKRACKVFEELNTEITCMAAYPNTGFEKNSFRRLIDTQSIFREYLATVYYYIRGYL